MRPEVARSPLDEGSRPYLEYVWSGRRDRRLFFFVVDAALRGDYMAHIARTALEGGTYETGPEAHASLASKKPGPRTKALRRSQQELLEMLLSRSVDNFQLYVVEIIRDVLRARPEILSGRKQEITLGQILQFGSIDDLVLDIVESRVSSLSYKGFADLKDWCAGRGIPLVVPEESYPAVAELIALRNIVVHNRGRVDPRYQAVVGPTSPALGEPRPIDVDEFFEALDLLDRVVELTDVAVSAKFGLERAKVVDELAKRASEHFPDEDTDPTEQRTP